MLLAVDIGNTNMEFGLFREDILIANFRLVTNRNTTSDEVGLSLIQFLGIHNITTAEIEDVIIGSVVPQVMYSVSNAMRKYIGKEPLVVGENFSIDIENWYDNPKEVGVDRLINAYAAYHKYGGNLIVVDFGTATTFDVVGEHGVYLGGLIYPGIKISMDALFTNAAKLPRVELAKPRRVIGKTTVESMQAGAVYGYVGAVENIVKKIDAERSVSSKVIATGGLAGMIGQQTDCFCAVDKTLTLFGLQRMYRAEQNKFSDEGWA